MHAHSTDRPWGRPDPAVAEIRVAVRRSLEVALPALRSERGAARPLVLVALSGGADSLALAAALAFEADRAHVRAGAIVVDHGLQEDSEAVAQRAARQADDLGLDPVAVRRVSVPVDDGDGPEAAARTARYTAIEAARVELGASLVLTAHTRDDQAEQVLLALARGSGTRALAGIPPENGAILRPLLEVSRETTERACAAQGLDPWRDPHNAEPRYARVRVRDRILPLLEREIGPGIAANLARTAKLAREDAEALDALAADAFDASLLETDREQQAGGRVLRLDVAKLLELPVAVRHRVIRRAARAVCGAQLTREHTLAISSLLTGWRGQGPIHAPALEITRSRGELILRAA